MRSTTRALGVLLTGSALLLATGTAAARPGPDRSIAWTPCPEDKTVECGTLRLPVDWADPAGEKFDLAVARRAASDPARWIGVLLVNPGGPGGSGVSFALRADSTFSPEVLRRFDIVGFDPRGVARSHPVRCSAELLQRQPSRYPGTQAEFDRLVAFNREVQADCRARTGPLAGHVDAKAVTRDMDALRAALGERQISYFGVSYGSLYGQRYAEEYGHRVRAMALDSGMDHSLGATAFAATEAAAAEDSFHEWVRWCERTPGCALHGRNLLREWDDLLAGADRGEVRDPADPGRMLTSAELTERAFMHLRDPAWAELADYVRAVLDQRPRTLAAPPETAPNPFPFVFCQDWRMAVRTLADLTRITELTRRIAPRLRGSLAGQLAVTGCLGAPAATSPQREPRLTTAPRLLLLHAAHDPISPYAWAVNLHRQARGGTALLTYDGWGHGVYRRSACTRAALAEHLLHDRLPAEGARCAAVE
ncbi:alpha/beta fold hydrolase [Crossiella sp. NPDC003009]